MYMHSRTSSNHFLRHATRSRGHFITLLFRSYMRSLSHTHTCWPLDSFASYLLPPTNHSILRPSRLLCQPPKPSILCHARLSCRFQSRHTIAGKEKRVILPLQTRIHASFKNNANKCTTPLRMHWCLKLKKIAKEVGDHPSPPWVCASTRHLPRP